MKNTFEKYLDAYVSLGSGLQSMTHQFTGTAWQVQKQQMLDSGKSPFVVKEAFLKACDRLGIQRPDQSRFVEETEAITDQEFWKTNVCPMTMLYTADQWSTGAETSMTEFGYEYTI